MTSAGTKRSKAQDPLPDLPRSEATERALLGVMLAGSPTRDPVLRAAIERLELKDFMGANARYFTCFAEMVREGKDPDLALAANRLHLSSEESAQLAKLTDGAPKICNTSHYIDLLKEKSMLRSLAYLGQTIQANALSANGNGLCVISEARKMLSTHLKEGVGEKRILEFKSGAQLAAEMPEKAAWIVPPYIAAGAITDICGKVKIGKTELVMHMVREVLDGSKFLGKATTKTSVVYLTEQPNSSLSQAMRRAGLVDRSDIFVLSHSKTWGLDWPVVAAAAIDTCISKGARLLVVDTLPQFAGLVGDSENNSGDALAAMLPLQKAASEGIAIVILRHERKSGGDVQDSGRGSSAIPGAADIVLSIRRQVGSSKNSVRLLSAVSRFSETPSEQIIDLTDDGYVSLGEPNEAAASEARNKILEIAPRTDEEALGEKELIESTGIPPTTAQRAIRELLKEGLLGRIGKGRRGDCFRYFLSEKPLSPTSITNGENRIESDPDLYPE